MADHGDAERSVVTRDTAWNQREYGREKWPLVEELIEEACGEETCPRLSQVVAKVARRERGRARSSLLEQEVSIAGVTCRVPQSLALGAYQAFVTETVVEACDGATDAVVELGSGWGRNLFFAWLAGASSDATYVGAELTDAGRRAATRIARLEPDLGFRSIPFDYTAPDLSAVHGNERAVVFTVHSVDYVPNLAPVVFDEIRRVARHVTCIHFENFGWQAADGARGGSAAEAYARENDYNQNLYRLLNEENRVGRIELQPLRLDVIGLHPRYVTSVAIWESSR